MTSKIFEPSMQNEDIIKSKINEIELQTVVGLEIHAQIATKTKLFSRAPIDSNAEANTCVDWLDMGMPGSLPIVNEEAIHMALKTALALNMTINEISIFDRKHYFYQDSPLGYQITQLFKPIGINGFLDCSFGRVRINRLHIESDAGKSIYEGEKTFIDLNRCGVGLMEIVTEPDFSSAEEVVEFVKELRSILLTLGTCKCNMEEGNLRVDVNISVHAPNGPLGTRVEIKNLNSFKFIADAIEYESNLHKSELKMNKQIIQETKLFDTKSGTTKSMRNKENVIDYRYFPDPDLLPVVLDKAIIEKYRNELPELPATMRQKHIHAGVGQQQAYALCENPIRSKFFERLIQELPKEVIPSASNWVVTELFGKLRVLNQNIEDFLEEHVGFCDKLSKIIVLCESSQLTRTNAKACLDHIVNNPQNNPDAFINEMNFLQSISEDEIEKLSKQILENFPEEVKKYKNGKAALLMFFVGNVIKETKGKANPEIAKKILLKNLEN
jgi:aspartyl-tRNA(Asn)/glutamyl-tRNA(Gln) amidotransferase subunit B